MLWKLSTCIQLGFGVWGSGVRGSGFRVQGMGFRVWGSGYGIQGFGVRGSGFGVVKVRSTGGRNVASV
jgi:hypothetical protein